MTANPERTHPVRFLHWARLRDDRAVALDPEDTQSLLDAARDGVPGAVDQLLLAHRPALLRLVRALLPARLGARVDASDVVQETLLAAARRLPAYLAQPQLEFLPWLRWLARERVVEARRRHEGAAARAVQREAFLGSAALRDVSSLDLSARLADPGATPGAAALRGELCQRVRAALDQLDDEDREILLLRHAEQLGNREAADLLGLSDQAAGMRHLRALRRLGALLRDDAPGPASRAGGGP